jgi:hypothetical protein
MAPEPFVAQHRAQPAEATALNRPETSSRCGGTVRSPIA